MERLMPATTATVLPAVAGILVSLLSIIWLPRFMRPAWVHSAENEEHPPGN
jgi:hypothetical protein